MFKYGIIKVHHGETMCRVHDSPRPLKLYVTIRVKGHWQVYGPFLDHDFQK